MHLMPPRGKVIEETLGIKGAAGSRDGD